ncbi:MAG: polymerase PB2 [Bactrocera correcta orthomyxo-like virus isolate Bz]|nr:MAG: polymerase PB2 [Bactrocera correcta orthomyxo-like virus isolate Bz]
MSAKERILEAIRKINNASEETIDILRKSKICQINVIERNSKSIKDPDPLSSMMANISLKFPITIDTEQAKKIQVPRHMLMNSTDIRYYNRTPCKLETVRWYIDNAPEVEENTKEIIQGLLTNNKKRLSVINGMDWKDVTYTMGSIEFSRKLVATNPLDIKIPKEFKRPIMAKVLGIENHIEYTRVPQDMVEEVKEILLRNNSLPYRSIPNIIHFLASELDEKYRYLPIIPGMNEDFLLVSHVLMQPSFNANNIGKFLALGHRKNEEITSVCISMLHYNSLYGAQDMIDTLKTITIGSVSTEVFIRDTYENKYIKAIKAIKGDPVSSHVEIRNVIFHPVPTNLTSQTSTTADGYNFTKMYGNEKVYFVVKGVKGYFSHNADAISEIKINRCDPNTIKVMLPSIATFCCKNFEILKAKTYTKLQEKSIIYWSKNLHDIVGVQEKVFNKLLINYDVSSEDDYNIGHMTITSGIDFQENIEQRLYLRGTSFYTAQNQWYMNMPKVTEGKIWSEKVNTPNRRCWQYLHPKILLKNILREIVQIIPQVIENIRKDIWFVDHKIILPHIIPRHRDGVVQKARFLCKQGIMIDQPNSLKILFYYIFTGYNLPFRDRPATITTFRFGEIQIDFNLLKYDAVLKSLDERNNALYICEKMIITEKTDLPREDVTFIGLSKNIELYAITNRSCDLPYKPYVWIVLNANMIPEKTKFLTNLRGQDYIAKKNSMFASEITRTMKRNIIVESFTSPTYELAEVISRKRNIDLDSCVDPSESAAKIAKYSTGSS